MVTNSNQPAKLQKESPSDLSNRLQSTESPPSTKHIQDAPIQKDPPEIASNQIKALRMTPRLATKLLGELRFEIAERLGVSTRTQIYNILSGKSSNPKVLYALHAEVMKLQKVHAEMGTGLCSAYEQGAKLK